MTNSTRVENSGFYKMETMDTNHDHDPVKPRKFSMRPLFLVLVLGLCSTALILVFVLAPYVRQTLATIYSTQGTRISPVVNLKLP